MKRVTTQISFVAAIWGAAACSTTSTAADGFETGPCLAGQCFDGLMCLSDLCVGDPDGAQEAGSPTGGSANGEPGGGDGNANGENTGAGNADAGNADAGNADAGNADSGTTDGSTTDHGTTDSSVTEGSSTDDGFVSETGVGTDTGGPPCGDNPGVPLGGACDPMAQNCAGCAKCTPWAANGVWTGARCSAVADDPAGIGEPCVAIGGADSGSDDCDVGAMCWDVDFNTLQGECLELCSDPEAPSCETSGTTCAVLNGGDLPLCLTECDPFNQSCPAGEGCYVITDTPICFFAAGSEAVGDTCTFINDCAPGSSCDYGGGGCPGDVACCAEYCVPQGAPCPAQQDCLEIASGVGLCVTA